MILYQCDRCKKIVDRINLCPVQIVTTSYTSPTQIEICDGCLTDLLQRWLKEPPSPLLHSQSCVSDNPSTPVEPSQAPQS